MEISKIYKANNIDKDLSLKLINRNNLETNKLEKIIISCGVKETLVNSNNILYPLTILELITNQKPIVTKAKKSVANFKLREGKIIGCKVTLRKQKMFSFLDKLLFIVLPQISDLKITKYKTKKPTNQFSIGLKDCSAFPEIENQYDLLNKPFGINITFVTKGKYLQEDNLIFSGFKLPFMI